VAIDDGMRTCVIFFTAAQLYEFLGRRLRELIPDTMKHMFAPLFLLVMIFCLGCAPRAVTENTPPNVVFIYADDLGIGDTGPYGQKIISTPHLDRLAAEGMRFTQFYTGVPVCAPARAVLMTGRHSGHAHVRANYGLPGYEVNVYEPGSFPLPDSIVTVADLFKKKGYTTGAIGKWGLGNYDNEGDPLKHGFDYFYGFYDQRAAHNFYPTHLWENGQWDSLNNPVIDVHPEGVSVNSMDPEVVGPYTGNDYAVDKMTDKARQFIRQNKDKPFFLYLPYTLPHKALQAPDAAVREYIKKLNEKPYYGESGSYAPTLYPASTYAAMVTYLDDQVGIVMNMLAELGLDDNTIVMFSSDNGPTEGRWENPDMFRSALNLRGLKGQVYEGGIRAPFIVRWQGKVRAGVVSDLPSVQYDMMATFADLLNVQAPKNDGISLLPTLLGNPEKQEKHPYLYWEYPASGGQAAIRTGDWKGVKTNLMKPGEHKWQLYNLKTDVEESRDVAAEHPEILAQLDEIVRKEHVAPVRREWVLF
jgi:arylsulfatase A